MANTQIRFILPQLSGQTGLSTKLYAQNGDTLLGASNLTETIGANGVFDGIISEALNGVYRHTILMNNVIIGYGLIELYDNDTNIYVADQDNEPSPLTPVPSNFTEPWQIQSIAILRGMIGDTDSAEYEYSDQRLIQLFTLSGSLVLLDAQFDNDYIIDVPNFSISPTPSGDLNFMGLVSLRSMCVLLGSEMRSKSHNRVTVKDGPSSVSMDHSDLLSSIKENSKTYCKKYEDALFKFRAGRQVGQAILGPYAPASFLLRRDNNFRG